MTTVTPEIQWLVYFLQDLKISFEHLSLYIVIITQHYLLPNLQGFRRYR